MTRFGELMAEKISAAQEGGLKVSVFDDQGHLLWYSPDWQETTGSAVNPAEVCGKRWLEFVHHKYVAAVKEWLAAPDGAEVKFIAHSASKRDAWVAVAMIKQRVGQYWLAVGDNRMARPDEVPDEDLPALGCAMPA